MKNFAYRTFTISFPIFLVFFICVFQTISGMFQEASSLDWKDSEWRTAHCPKNITGSWLSRDGENIIQFNDNLVISKYGDNQENIYRHRSTLKSLGKQFIEIALTPKGSSDPKPLFLRIRPHLAFNDKQSKTSECYIKIFRFNTRKDANFNKYISWEIYKHSK
tara:strand:- start:34 stop:522 length:489 start_codon:yes stop_codon:yes gene_type:complete